MSARKRAELTLRDKVRLIKASAGKSYRQLAEDFKIGRTRSRLNTQTLM